MDTRCQVSVRQAIKWSCFSLIRCVRVRVCQCRWRYGRRRGKRDVESWGKTNQNHGYRRKLISNQTKDSECQKFVEDANKITDLLQEFDRTGIKDIDTFSSLATSIVNATDETGAFHNGDCNDAQQQALVKVHGICSLFSLCTFSMREFCSHR